MQRSPRSTQSAAAVVGHCGHDVVSEEDGRGEQKKAKERRGWEAEELTNGSAMRERKVERAGAWSHEGGEWESKKERGT